MLTNIRNCLNKSTILKVLHGIACALGSLVAAFGLLTCVCQFYSALCDLRRHSGLGFSYSLQYFLRKEYFGAWVVFFLVVTGELVLYIFLCHRAEKKEPISWGVWYLGTTLAIHAAAWISFYSLQIPIPYLFDSDKVEWLFTILPSIAYFTLYLMRVRKCRPREKSDNCYSQSV